MTLWCRRWVWVKASRGATWHRRWNIPGSGRTGQRLRPQEEQRKQHVRSTCHRVKHALGLGAWLERGGGGGGKAPASQVPCGWRRGWKWLQDKLRRQQPLREGWPVRKLSCGAWEGHEGKTRGSSSKEALLPTCKGPRKE